MSNATDGDDRHPHPGAIHDNWQMPQPSSVIVAVMGYGQSYSAGANAPANQRKQSTHHDKEDHE